MCCHTHGDTEWQQSDHLADGLIWRYCLTTGMDALLVCPYDRHQVCAHLGVLNRDLVLSVFQLCFMQGRCVSQSATCDIQVQYREFKLLMCTFLMLTALAILTGKMQNSQDPCISYRYLNYTFGGWSDDLFIQILLFAVPFFFFCYSWKTFLVLPA